MDFEPQPDHSVDQPAATSRPDHQLPTAPGKRSAGQLSGVQIVFAAILAIGMVLGINFSSRIASSRPLRAYYESVETEIAQLRREQQALIAERDFALSDAYVEQWARSEGRMVRPGEVIVIPVPPNAAAQSTPSVLPPVEVDTSTPEPARWMLWWSLFFDSPPPNF